VAEPCPSRVRQLLNPFDVMSFVSVSVRDAVMSIAAFLSATQLKILLNAPTPFQLMRCPMKDLKVGSFYWVTPAPDTPETWQHVMQPAQFAGKRKDGTLLWRCLNIEGISSWPMRFVGDEITQGEPGGLMEVEVLP
jgi:hypothetical protein